MQGAVFLDENCAYLPLTQAISQGNVQGVRDFLNERLNSTAIWIEAFEGSLLKACSYGQVGIVTELLHNITRLSEIRVKEILCLALDIAAGNGNYEIVEKLCEYKPELLIHEQLRTYGQPIPVVRASSAGHKRVTRYLYDITSKSKVLTDDEGYWATYLLLDTICYGYLDIALAIIKQFHEQDPPLALALTKHPRQRLSPLRFLATKPDFFRSHSNLGLWGRLIYSCIHFEYPTETSQPQNQRLFWMTLPGLPEWFGIKQIYELKVRHVKAHYLLQKMCNTLPAMVKNESWKETVYKALLDAVENGNKEFVIEIVKCNPQLLWITEETSGRNIFQLAVKFRKEKIFNLIYGLDDRKVLLLRSYDEEHNNILHIAAHHSPSNHLSKVSGAALRMQRESQWFEEVKSLVSEHEVVQKNNENKTPRQVFEESHENLRKEGEEWMKYTATACSFVATLIATVTFQAIFTVPGGNDQTLGEPLLIKDPHFMAFIVVDSLSFFTSCASVLIFLSILTARYSFDDFIVSLPRKMILGLTILFFSIASMLVAFTTGLFTPIRQKPILLVFLVPFAYLPAVLFLLLQYPLLKEMIYFTYGKGLFDRNTKHWF